MRKKKYLMTKSFARRGTEKRLKDRGLTCMAPTDAGGDAESYWSNLCGVQAVTERVAEGVVFPLCAAHADKLDEEERSGK